MNRIAPLVIVLTSSLMFAQQSSQSSTGWRRVGDPPPAPAASGQNPEPVARDQYGQPNTQPVPDAARAPEATPGQDTVPPDDTVTTPAPAPMTAPEAYPQQPQPPSATTQPQSLRPAYGLPREVTLRPGTYVTVRINQPLSSDRNHEGDPFSATLMQPVVVDGIVIAQRGQSVYGRVAEAEKAHVDKPSRLKLELTSLTLADGTQVQLQSQLLTRQGGRTPGAVQAGTVVGTTAVGAAIGGAAAWGTGAAIGAGAGAAAGIIGVLVTRHHPTVVYPETALTFQVTSPLTVALDRAPQAFRYVGPEDYQQGISYSTRPAPRPAPVYAYPHPYYGYPWGYPYGWWGPSVGVYVGGGWGWGGWGGRRYYYRR